MGTNFLLPAIIIAIIGFVAGILLTLLFVERSRSESQPENEPLAASQPQPAEVPSTAFAELPPDQYHPVASLYREKTSGALVVEAGHKIYKTSKDLGAGAAQEMRQTVESWHNWLGLRLPEEIAPITIRTENMVIHKPEPAVIAAVIDKPQATTVVGQIDEILQTMLRESGQPEQHISLAQDPTQGVVVWVGMERYVGIGAVPDEKIKALIQSAVRKWEALHSV